MSRSRSTPPDLPPPPPSLPQHQRHSSCSDPGTESSSQPATMAEAASVAVPEPLLRGLPDEISIWEIFVRLPPKAVLRCRAVCPAWRRVTSSRDFLLAHHGRQPTLPLLYACEANTSTMNIIPFDHQAGITAVDQLQPLARLGDVFDLEASCDGLLVLSINGVHISICNPATRQYAPLLLLRGFKVLGMYMYSPTSEYRLLLYRKPTFRLSNFCSEDRYYVFTFGSGQPPRQIGYADSEKLGDGWGTPPVLFNGSLHWYRGPVIMVFDITTELFRRMCSPIVSSKAQLFEIDGMLGMSSLQDEEMATATLDIWVMQDYGSEVWVFKHGVELPVASLTLQFGNFLEWSVVVPSGDGDLLVLLKFDDWVLQIDINGKLVASFHTEILYTTEHLLKQTLVPQTFFPTLEGYVVNTSPFA